MLEKHPVVTLVILPTALCETDLVVLIVLLSQIHQYTPALEQTNCLSIVEGVREGGDAAVWVDLEEPGFFLLVGGDVDVLGFVGQAKFFEGDGDLDSVGRGVGVEGDVGPLRGHGRWW